MSVQDNTEATRLGGYLQEFKIYIIDGIAIHKKWV